MNLVASLIAQFALSALQHRGQSRPMWIYLLGIFFLALGGAFGCYFIFHFLVPLIGYIETGMLFSVIFIGCGTGLFLCKPQKKPDSATQLLSTAKSAIEKVDVSDMIQKHSGKIMIGAILVGGVLSQLLSTKKSSGNHDEESDV